MPITYEDAMNLLVRWCQNPDHGDFGRYGYDIYLPALILTHLRREQHVLPPGDQHNAGNDIGILRARVGPMQTGNSPPRNTRLWSASHGRRQRRKRLFTYSIWSPWLAEADRDTFVPTEPERFAKMLARFRDRLGPGFQERGQEAIRCYGAHAYLACCAMCGAAAESALLATAIAKTGDEPRVLTEYAAVGGRGRVENMILGQAPKALQVECRGYTSLLKYWRDEASHGRVSGITDNEAYTALALLLRFVMFVNDQWAELTT